MTKSFQFDVIPLINIVETLSKTDKLEKCSLEQLQIPPADHSIWQRKTSDYHMSHATRSHNSQAGKTKLAVILNNEIGDC